MTCPSGCGWRGRSVHGSPMVPVYRPCFYHEHGDNRLCRNVSAPLLNNSKHTTPYIRPITHSASLPKPRSHDWYIRQTLVTCRYLPRHGNGAIDTGHLSECHRLPANVTQSEQLMFVYVSSRDLFVVGK